MSKIGWTDITWNPVVGCTKTSPGCKNCYAEKMAHRLAAQALADERANLDTTTGKGKYVRVIGHNKKWCGNTAFDKRELGKPDHWRKSRQIFVCSMGDLFHHTVLFQTRYEIWIKALHNPHHTFIWLTKRPEEMKIFIEFLTRQDVEIAGNNILPNLILMTTVENQRCADERIPHLINTPAAVRGLSIEPLLEDVLLPRSHLGKDINWIIIGCESGPSRRPCKLEWVRNIINQCDEAQVKIFVKQLDIDGRVSKNMDEWPKWARLREYP